MEIIRPSSPALFSNALLTLPPWEGAHIKHRRSSCPLRTRATIMPIAIRVITAVKTVIIRP